MTIINSLKWGLIMVVPLTVVVLSQWAVNQRALSMQRRVSTKTKVTVCWTRPVACLAWAVARLAAPPSGVTEGLLWALLNTFTSWQGRAAKRQWHYFQGKTFICISKQWSWKHWGPGYLLQKCLDNNLLVKNQLSKDGRAKKSWKGKISTHRWTIL